ncbi:MAG: hypothetical protein ABJC13_21080 [Acidobacteriota bacterium]
MNRTTTEMLRRSVSIALAFALLGAVTPALRAHEGHNHNEHKERCTLQKIELGKIEIKAADGDLETVVLTAETKVLRGGKATTAADLKVGEKAIVTMIHEKVGVRAIEIRVGAEKKRP